MRATYISYNPVAFFYIILKNIRSGEKKKLVIKLMKYIKMILTNMRDKFMHTSLSTVDTSIHSLIVSQIGIFGGCCRNIRKIKIPEE